MKNLRWLSLIMVIGLVSLALTGCGSNSSSGNSSSGDVTAQSSGSKETVYEFYSKVQLDQTKEQIDAVLGVEPKQSSQLETSYSYLNQDSSFGVDVVYDENGKAMNKTLIYPNREDLAFMTPKPVTQEQSDKITKGMSYDEVKSLLGGDGIETSVTEISFADNKLSYIRVWINKDESMLQVVFGTDGTANDSMFFD